MILRPLTTLDFDHRTTLAWHPDAEEFTIHRPPTEDPKINHGFESAPHTLFTSRIQQGQDTEEHLTVRAFFDRSVLEVFVNDRTVISTRVYHPAGKCFGIRFFADPSGGYYHDSQTTKLLRASVWDGLGIHT
jgi:beta-fructofuranosidase